MKSCPLRSIEWCKVRCVSAQNILAENKHTEQDRKLLSYRLINVFILLQSPVVFFSIPIRRYIHQCIHQFLNLSILSSIQDKSRTPSGPINGFYSALDRSKGSTCVTHWRSLQGPGLIDRATVPCVYVCVCVSEHEVEGSIDSMLFFPL